MRRQYQGKVFFQALYRPSFALDRNNGIKVKSKLDEFNNMKKETAAKTKIAFILPALTAGGAERVVITLMNGLDRDRFDPVLIHVINKGPLGDLVDPKVRVVGLNRNGVFAALPWLLKALWQEKPDIILSTMAHMNFAVLLLRPFLGRVKLIVREAIVPSYILEKYPRLAGVIRLAYQILYRQADVILSPSQMIIDEFNQMPGLVRANHVLLYNPVDIKRIEDKIKAGGLEPASPSIVRFVAAGRLEHQKGFDRLIENLKYFQPEFAWELSILGEGEERVRLQQLIDNVGLQRQVFLRGHQENPWVYYHQADCFLLPSRFEGLPNVALESLTCGTPVIAMNEAGGIAEIRDRAPHGAVRIVGTMEDFIQAMTSVQPIPLSARINLLPPEFNKDKVSACFQNLLEQVSQGRHAL